MTPSFPPSTCYPRRLGALLLALALAACNGSGTSPTSTTSTRPPASPAAAPAADAAPPASILSAYYGLDKLPAPILLLCSRSRSLGADGIPATFSVRLDSDSVQPEAFVVETATGERVTPKCATLRPADEQLENRTVLLAGTFGTPAAQPQAVEVVGDLQDVQGRSLKGLRTEQITALEDGPSILLAERFAPDTPGQVPWANDRQPDVG